MTVDPKLVACRGESVTADATRKNQEQLYEWRGQLFGPFFSQNRVLMPSSVCFRMATICSTAILFFFTAKSSLSRSSRLLKNWAGRAISGPVCVISECWAFVEWFFALPSVPGGRFSTMQRHYGPDLLRSNCGGHQISHAHQVVGGARKAEHPIDLQRSPMPHLAE